MNSVADPGPGSDAFFDPCKKSGSESGMNNPDHISDSLETIIWFKILKFFNADPGWKNSEPGSGINILDPQHWL
jgi:hypothetical protein